MISSDDANLERFGRHVPRILGNQIIAQLVDQYLSDMNAPSIEPEFEKSCPPSIERFHAALLFVDISGFTVLSQRLPVDALRLHINAYFKKILDIIFKYGGDVVKFAGDALFIVWQTPVTDMNDPNFEEAARISVQRAVSCGQQINVECSNYKINLAPKNKQQTSQLTSALLDGKLHQHSHSHSHSGPGTPVYPPMSSLNRPSNLSVASLACTTTPRVHGSISPHPGSPPNESSAVDTLSELGGGGSASSAGAHSSPNSNGGSLSSAESNTVTYLNVHSGVGVGVLAGIDVGSNHRWEYLLLGEPLSDVAVAESMASKGDLVISPAAHALLCGTAGTQRSSTGQSPAIMTPGGKATAAGIATIDEQEALPSEEPASVSPYMGCQCAACAENPAFYRVDPSIQLVPAVNTETPEELADYDLYFYSEIMERSTVAYREIMHQIDEICYNKSQLIGSSSMNGNGAEGGQHSISLTSLPTFNMTISPRASYSSAALAGPTSACSTVDKAGSITKETVATISERMGETAESAAVTQHNSADTAQLTSSETGLGLSLSNSSSLDFNSSSYSLNSSVAAVKQIGTINEELLESSDINHSTSNHATSKTAVVTKCPAEVTELMFGHYLTWVQQCLLDDFAMHVHEADRTDYEFRASSRKGSLEKFASSQFAGINPQLSNVSLYPSQQLPNNSLSTSTSAGNIAGSVSNGSTSNQNTPPRRGSNFKSGSFAANMSGGTSSREPSSFVHKMRALNTSHLTLKEQNKSKNRRIRSQDTSLAAELRNVIVLFISLRLDTAQLLVSASGPTSEKNGTFSGPTSEKNPTFSGRVSEKLSGKASLKCYSREGDLVRGRIRGFHFLTRTEEEFNDDQRIMNSFQDCMEIITRIFKDNGGQMRQFIVDDKGTVCIGTFGLRGSVTNDNAAAAIDAAGAIIMQLHKIGIAASIGITSGKAYCGEVGSPLRHEYAVMGPSTNLSARLMGKAKSGEIMCDGETRNRDRTHTFIKLAEIQAKGYVDPVPTFKPNISKSRTARMDSNSAMQMSLHGLNRMETMSGKSTTFFDPSVMQTMNSPSFRGQHSLFDLSASSGSTSNLQTPLNSKGGRGAFNRLKSRNKTPMTGEHTHKLPLQGRTEECDDIFAFLCPAFVKEFGPLTSFSPTGNAGKFGFPSAYQLTSPPTVMQSPVLSPARRLRFSTSDRTRAAILQGPSGIGKTSFLKIFCEKVRNIHKSDHSINMFVFHCRTSANNAQPFNLWKGVVRQIFVQFAAMATAGSSLRPTKSVAGRSHGALVPDVVRETETAAMAVAMSGKQDLTKGLDYAMSLLSAELQEYKPLLASIHFVYGAKENEATAKLSGVAKLLKITELLSALLQQFSTVTNKLLIVAIDDLHQMDAASWQLLKHLWEHNTGLVLVASHTSNVTAKKGVDISIFSELERIHLETLQPLGLASTKLIASTIFASNGVGSVEDVVFEKLHSMSGGNALFLYELAKAMLEWYHRSLEEEQADGDCSSTTAARGDVSFSAAIQDFRTTRIEEVICYRFDQFDTAAQLLLKLASVACANAEVFSLPLLDFMIQDDSSTMSAFACLQCGSMDEYEGAGSSGRYPSSLNGESDTVGFEPEEPRRVNAETETVLVETLNSLLNNNEFIKIVSKRQQESITGSVRTMQPLRMGNSGASLLDDDTEEGDEAEGEEQDTVGELSPHGIPSPGKHSKLRVVPVKYIAQNAAASLARMYFDFKIRLEQSTIYDLMLDDQKQALHERVASYLEHQTAERIRNDIPLTSTELYEEGFHWERATGWSSAMSCYYRSAMLLDEVGAYQDSFLHLTAAYRMLNAMRTDAGVTEDFQFAPASFQAIFSHGKVSEKDNIHALKKSDIVRIFGGDSALLELGLNVLLRLAQSSFTLSDSPEVTSKLYEDALQLIMLTWNWKDALALNQDLGAKLGLDSSIDDLDPIPVPVRTPMRSPGKLSRSKTHQSDFSDIGNFGLQDPTIVFPILAGIAALYRNKKLQDDKERTKESTLYDLSLVLARTSPAYLPHLICAMCLQRTLIFELGLVKESLTMTDGIVSMYNERQHAATLIKAYGNNRVPYTIMMHVQLLRTVGYLTKSTVMLNEVLDSIPMMTHLHSVGLIVYPVISVMLLEGSQRVALEVFNNYLELERERGGYNFFKEANPLFLEALEIASVYETFTVDKDLSAFIAHSQTASSLDIEGRVLNKEFLPVDRSSRSLLYETLTSFGTSVEHCCGLLLLLKARMTSKRIELRREERQALVWKYLFTALEYEAFHISCCVEASESGQEEVPIDRLAFSHFGSLVTKACILALMAHYDAEIANHPVSASTGDASSVAQISIDRQEAISEATAALQCVEQIGVSKGYHFITLHAGVYLEILGIDTRRGKQLQAQALDAMQKLNGAADFALAFDGIIAAFPILERFKIKYTLRDESWR